MEYQCHVVNNDNSVAIAEAGGIAPLVALARGGTDGQKVHAAEALPVLAYNDDNKAIARAGGTAPLVVRWLATARTGRRRRPRGRLGP